MHPLTGPSARAVNITDLKAAIDDIEIPDGISKGRQLKMILEECGRHVREAVRIKGYVVETIDVTSIG